MIDHLLAGATCSTGSIYGNPIVQTILGDLHPGGVELTKELAKRSGLPVDSKVMDVGCGLGNSSFALADHGWQMFGIDSNPDAIRQAIARVADHDGFSRIGWSAPEFVVSDDGTWPTDVHFDGVLSECALCLMGEPKASLESLANNLQPGGKLLLSDVTVELQAAPFQEAAGFSACLGGALPWQELQELVGQYFAIEYADNRPELIGEIRRRIYERVEVDAVLELVGKDSEIGRLVSSAEQAFASGHLGYGIIVASKL